MAISLQPMGTQNTSVVITDRDGDTINLELYNEGIYIQPDQRLPNGVIIIDDDLIQLLKALLAVLER